MGSAVRLRSADGLCAHGTSLDGSDGDSMLAALAGGPTRQQLSQMITTPDGAIHTSRSGTARLQ